MSVELKCPPWWFPFPAYLNLPNPQFGEFKFIFKGIRWIPSPFPCPTEITTSFGLYLARLIFFLYRRNIRTAKYMVMACLISPIRSMTFLFQKVHVFQEEISRGKKACNWRLWKCAAWLSGSKTLVCDHGQSTLSQYLVCMSIGWKVWRLSRCSASSQTRWESWLVASASRSRLDGDSRGR